MKDTLVLLIRHGLTPTTGQVLPGRAPGLHLSDKGQEQAREVAKRLDPFDLAAIYSSPLERTRETAAPTAGLFRLETRIDDRLLECEFGEWTGAKLSELARLEEWKTVQQNPSEFRFPGGESFVEMQERIVGGIRDLAARHPGETIACFSHADPIKAALTSFEGMELDRFQSVAVDPASVSSLRIDASGNASVLRRNTTSGELV